MTGYFVPDTRFTMDLGSCYPPGCYFGVIVEWRSNTLHQTTVSFWLLLVKLGKQVGGNEG